MGKKFLMAALVILLFNNVSQGSESGIDNPWYTSKNNLVGKKVFYELFGGVSYSNMLYSNSIYDKSERELTILPDLGLSVRFQLSKWISINPRVSYSNQGIEFKGIYDYKLKTNSAVLLLPIDYQFVLGDRDQTSTTKLFLFAGPFVSTPINERITTGSFTGIIKFDDLQKPDYGFDAGIGFRIPTFSLEGRSLLNLRLSYYRGFTNTYSRKEAVLSTALINRLYLNGGKRFNSGFRFLIGIEIPQKNKKIISYTAGSDGKKNFKKVVIIDEK